MRLFRALRQSVAWCDKPTFTQQDREQVSQFLKSATGRKMMLWLQSMVAAKNEEAAASGDPHKCGQAVGYKILFNAFRYFVVSDNSPTASVQVGPTQLPDDDASGESERLAP